MSELREKNNTEALKNFDVSLDYRRKISKNHNSEAGLIHSQKGIVYLIMGEYETAVKEFDTASKCFSSSRTQELLECHTNLGQAYLNLGKEEAARTNFLKALKFNRSGSGNPVLKSKCCLNLGNIYYNRGEANEAIKFFSQALAQYKVWTKAPVNDVFNCKYKIAKLEIDYDKDHAISSFTKAITYA